MNETNAVGWFDLHVNDMERATSFYETLFQTNLEVIEDPTGETTMCAFPSNREAHGAAGALVKSPHGQPGVGGTLLYFHVEDCGVAEARVLSARGKVIRSKFSIGDFGWVSLCMDTEGNIFGLSSMS